MENEFTNPFAGQNLSMTSLEKVLKGSRNATEAANIDRTATKRKKEVIVRGVLSVTVISAKDLPVMDVMGKADPFDYMGRSIMTLTRVILEGEVRDSFPLEGTTSATLELYLKWAPQPIYRDS
ncbi:hypothetical protein BHE74_00032062 [Ensete ventricosum]|uniref:Uncharacterized protein n=1 Tax=Ensete ventricosum TaxID=4639 RepID=A0A444F3L9_ENSVE|nr:hypothetical protein GW17_00018874 [Ensete ventricosum]RWW60900.1 hypothetical protein BHE74_00032062 [Ensete ventricosum]RZR71644.1 hypothetical protein BHM03_00006233 [Ensete ventricosum]